MEVELTKTLCKAKDPRFCRGLIPRTPELFPGMQLEAKRLTLNPPVNHDEHPIKTSLSQHALAPSPPYRHPHPFPPLIQSRSL